MISFMAATTSIDSTTVIPLGAVMAVVGAIMAGAGSMIVSAFSVGRKLQHIVETQNAHGLQLDTVIRATEEMTRFKIEISSEVRRLREDFDLLRDERERDMLALRLEIGMEQKLDENGIAYRILLVDDDKEFRYLFRRNLCKAFQVDEATTLKQANEMMQRALYDAVVLDLCLTDGGLQKTVTDFLHSNPAALCLAMSGNETPGLDLMTMKQGADGFLRKDGLSRESLSRMLRLSILRRKARAPLA